MSLVNTIAASEAIRATAALKTTAMSLERFTATLYTESSPSSTIADENRR
jgi:hypothetical protein